MQTKTKMFLLSFLILSIFSISAIRALAINVSTGLVILPSPTGIFHLMVQWAIPEKRVGALGTNDDTSFYLTIREPLSHSVIWTQPGLLNTDTEGKYLGDIVVENQGAGTYDIGFKGSTHLTKVLRGAPLSSGNTFVANFTNDTVSPIKGSLRLISGDINGDGLTPATSGDDVVNSADLSLMLYRIDQSDPTGNSIRANLNQDTEVNAVDLSTLLENIDKEGEK